LFLEKALLVTHQFIKRADAIMKRTFLKKGRSSFSGAPIERLGILCRMMQVSSPDKIPDRPSGGGRE
jgi:hypothetical protein